MPAVYILIRLLCIHIIILVGLLPLPSLEDPLTAAKVQSLKKEGRDWFREFLLPEALSLFSQAVDPIRGQNTRLAVLDGRIRSRTWGKHFLRALEPWDSLQHLIPD